MSILGFPICCCCCCFFSHHAACRISVPSWELNPSPQQWKLWVLITQLPQKSLNCSFIYTSFLKDFDCTGCFYRNTSFSVMGRFNRFNTLVIVQWGNKQSALATGMEVTQRFSNRGFHSPRSIWLQPLLSAHSANSRGQHPTSNMVPFPRESASCLVTCCLNYPASNMEGVVPYFTRRQLLWIWVFLLPEMLLPKPSSMDLQSHFPLPWYHTLLRNAFQRKQNVEEGPGSQSSLVFPCSSSWNKSTLIHSPLVEGYLRWGSLGAASETGILVQVSYWRCSQE